MHFTGCLHRKEYDDENFIENGQYLMESIGDLNGLLEGKYDLNYRANKNIYLYSFNLELGLKSGFTSMKIVVSANKLPSKKSLAEFEKEIKALL